MTIEPVQGFDGAFVISPLVREDERGFFLEAYKKSVFVEAGIASEFVQDSHSRSNRGVLRGLHFQWDPPMGKLMRVTAGSAFLVAVDIRKNSPSLGKWFGVEVSAGNKKQVFAPAGFARGFQALEDGTEVQYKCTGEYNKAAESGIRYNDPHIAIEWPVTHPIVSEKDAIAQTLQEWLSRPESAFFSA